jgi:hypothetical protein
VATASVLRLAGTHQSVRVDRLRSLARELAVLAGGMLQRLNPLAA